MKYSDYINNKRVAFIGGCHNLTGTDKGDIIDQYDVVVRTNGSIYLLGDENYNKDYGNRCDVLYTNNQFYREMHPWNMNDLKHKGVKYIRMKTCNPNYLDILNRDVKAEIIKNAIKTVNKELYGALMGAYIFTDILSYKPKELYVDGIDFFISKFKEFKHDRYTEYLEEYLPRKIRNQGNIINVGKREDGHNPKVNTDYIKKLYEKHDNFILPEHIKDLMYEIVEGKIEQREG